MYIFFFFFFGQQRVKWVKVHRLASSDCLARDSPCSPLPRTFFASIFALPRQTDVMTRQIRSREKLVYHTNVTFRRCLSRAHPVCAAFFPGVSAPL